MTFRTAMIGTVLTTASLLIAPAALAQSGGVTAKQEQSQILDNTVCPVGQVAILDDTIRPNGNAPKPRRGKPKPAGGNSAILDNTFRPKEGRCRPAPVDPGPTRP